MPVFAEGEVIAFTANIAHWNDVGGMVPGSMSTEAREIYQEGLRLPGVKLVSEGEADRAVVEIMKANSRMPDFLEGDLWAGIAAVRLGERRIGELVERYGKDTFTAAMRHFMAYGEQVSRAALRELPHGRFTLSEEQDSGVTYHVTVEISDDEFTIDLRDNPDQDDGPNNASRDGATIAAQMLFKNLTDPQGVANAGTFAPLRLLTRPGSVFDASPPAALGIYYEVEIRLYDLIWRCLAQHLDGRLPAGGFASICGTLVFGVNPVTGRRFSIIEPQLGGWGGSPGMDGNSAVFSGFHGDTYNCPAEVAEARYGLYVDRLALNPAPGGEGRHRGGKGIVLEYRVRVDGTHLTCAYSRSKNPPWGFGGGLDGSPNLVEIVRRDGSIEQHAVVNGLQLYKDDVIRVITGNGGGYGDPKERPAELVERDVRDGYVTPERAQEIYGRSVRG
jgi:N-methylhydantoinase B